MILTKNTIYHRSELGHNGFQYPRLPEELVLETDTEVLMLAWGAAPGYKAFLIVNQSKNPTFYHQVIWVKQ